MQDQQNDNGHVTANSNTAAPAVGAHANDVLAVPGGQAWRRLLAQGTPSSEELAALLKTIPKSAWSPLLLDAQRDPRLGNGFVQQAVQKASGSAGVVLSIAPNETDAVSRPISKPKDHQPDASGGAVNFVRLPAESLKIVDLTMGALANEVDRVGDGFRDLPPVKRTALATGWKARIEGGSGALSVAEGGAVANAQIGYRNAVRRSDGSYSADVTWRLFFSHEHGKDAVEEIVATGTIIFNVKPGATIAHAEGASGPGGVVPVLDPSAGGRHEKGAISCHDGAPVDDKCFLSKDDRGEKLANARTAIGTARLNFVQACESEKSRLKAAYDSDQAFGMALVEMMLGFGMGKLVKGAAAQIGKAAAGKAPTEMDLWGKGLPSEPGIAAHAGEVAASAKNAEAIVGQLASIGKKSFTDSVKPGLGSQSALLDAIKAGSHHSFDLISKALASVTDEELVLANGAFLNVTEAGYAAILRDYVPNFIREVASIGEHEAPYSADFAERLVWKADPKQGGKKRLARMREFHPNLLGAMPVPDQPNRQSIEFLGWVSEEMIPFAVERHNRIFGAIKDAA